MSKSFKRVLVTGWRPEIWRLNEAGTKVGPDQLGSTRTNSDRIKKNKKINKIGLGSTRIIKKKNSDYKKKNKICRYT